MVPASSEGDLERGRHNMPDWAVLQTECISVWPESEAYYMH